MEDGEETTGRNFARIARRNYEMQCHSVMNLTIIGFFSLDGGRANLILDWVKPGNLKLFFSLSPEGGETFEYKCRML